MFCRSGRIFVDKMVQQTTEEKHVSIFCHPLQRRASCLARALLFSSDFFPLSVIFLKKKSCSIYLFCCGQGCQKSFPAQQQQKTIDSFCWIFFFKKEISTNLIQIDRACRPVNLFIPGGLTLWNFVANCPQ